jgi:hypothetical protein
MDRAAPTECSIIHAAEREVCSSINS